ncbi:HAD-IA family hydrolase [Streptosporangium roseum]|uniref:HAD-IA family hydrolase n=1 Tax=Streptosporangium roseum TaxID=2001 RepID=UPI00332822A0
MRPRGRWVRRSGRRTATPACPPSCRCPAPPAWPEGFLPAARRLSADPARRVAFEDSIAGIAAAEAAGMRCVGIATTRAGTELTAADLVVADPTGVQ